MPRYSGRIMLEACCARLQWRSCEKDFRTMAACAKKELKRAEDDAIKAAIRDSGKYRASMRHGWRMPQILLAL